MEGLARNRRLRGLPALAIAWGIISDVGAAAINDKARKQLIKLKKDQRSGTYIVTGFAKR